MNKHGYGASRPDSIESDKNLQLTKYIVTF